ncbi:DUF1273 domain-containing protein [Bacillus sp. AGMB 02131]|uniref:UPF0398 protein IEO70_19110 n=1 Tax=Peribacillus faecalis TaxID=2772559 RepID=A0A927D2N7_9BACI|nr:DUF1273 domain-containing protein [Peribacillus faecalis]MBD3110440.1 DUF1273 domain-containing protein [Peribacillus faecalis]
MLKVLYITGYKNFELGIFDQNAKEVVFIKKEVRKRLEDFLEEGLEWVIISGQLGVELWAGEVVLELKKSYPQLRLAIITPFLQHESNWNEKNQEYYQSIASQADFVQAVSNQPYVSPAQFKNRDQFLLNKTDGTLIFYDDENEGSPQYFWRKAREYAENHPYEVFQISFYDIQQIIEEAAYEHNNE